MSGSKMMLKVAGGVLPTFLLSAMVARKVGYLSRNLKNLWFECESTTLYYILTTDYDPDPGNRSYYGPRFVNNINLEKHKLMQRLMNCSTLANKKFFI